MIKRLIKYFNDLGIRVKLFICLFLMISIPFCIFIGINTYVSSKDSAKQALDSSRKMLLQAKSSLDYKSIYIKNALDMLALNDTIQELVYTDSKIYEDDIGTWMYDRDRFAKQIFSIHSNPDISALQLYMSDGLAKRSETEEFLSMDKALNSNWFKQMRASGEVYRSFPSQYFPNSSSEKSISFLRIITRPLDINNVAGIIKADVPEKNINSVLKQALFTSNTEVILINSNNEIISSAGTGNSSDSSKYTEALKSIDYNKLHSNLWKTVTLQKEKILLGVESIDKTDWKLVLMVPYKDILKLNTKSRNQMILILVIVLPLTLPLSYWVAASSTKRIRDLISHMRMVVHGDFNVSILPSNNDEIGELTHNFNYMLTQIAILIEKQYQLGQEVKNMELKALQAQINPHFLYNTLDLINWMSMKYNAPKIGEVITSLSKFYRLSLSKGIDLVPIKNEIDQVSAYVQIQNMRYDDEVEFIINIPEELYEYKMPKITLQPLIENSILHGIFEKDDEKGTISLSGELKEGKISIFVEDDGVGIPAEKLQHLLKSVDTKDMHGYGVRNIHERLQLIYGQDYGLFYSSTEGVGTVVEVRIPAEK
ncbi:MAG TPA: sensor histidine kinase [Ruminiclostridium sp.]|nr:sensor histidine kinase [Ruminiclostridium sp.]